MTMINVCDNDQVNISSDHRQRGSISVSKYGDILARWHFCDERCAAEFFADLTTSPDKS